MSRFADAITTTGYVRVKMADIISDLNALVLAAGGSEVDIDPRSPVGQGIGGIAEMLSDLEGIAADTYTALANPSAATDTMLAGLALLTGVQKNGATYSTAAATFTGTNGTVIPTTARVKSTFDGSLWAPATQVTIGATPTAGTLVCKTIGPPVSGDIPAASLTSIQTVIAGWSAVTNSLGVAGATVEGDANLRVRRQQSVAIASQGMTDGLQAALQAMVGQGVTQAVVWENETDVPRAMNGGSLLPHSIYVVVVVQPGTNADPDNTSATDDPIANKIFLLKSGGCTMQGSITKTAVDEQGHSNTIHYDKATVLTVDLRMSIVARSNWPSDGADRIQAAIVAWMNGTNADTGKPNVQIGGDSTNTLSWTDVLASFINTVEGFNLTSMQFSVDGGSTWLASGDNVPVDFNEIASIVSGDITVTVT